MKIVENPKMGLNSIDLVDDNGVLLRITAESIVDITYDNRVDENFVKRFMGCPSVLPTVNSRALSLSVRFLKQTTTLQFEGDEAESIAESLQKLISK